MRKLLLVLLGLAGINSLLAAEPSPLALTAADNGKTNAVKVGQAVVVALPGNITTGYSWQLDGIDGKAVAADGEITYRTDRHLPGKVGVGGMFQAKFKAQQPGEATVRLKYCRPWEKDEKPAETFAITLAVEK